MPRFTTAVVLACAAAALTAPAAANAADPCPNAAYRSGAGARLPDCRAYEQVSPADKGGLPVSPVYSAFFNADGTRGVFAATSSLGGDPSAFTLNPYRATRGSTWSTDAMNIPQGDVPNPALGSDVQAVSSDLTREVVVSRRKLTPDAVEGGGNVYLHDIGGAAAYRLIATVPAAGTQSAFFSAVQSYTPLVDSASPDLEHIVFGSDKPLTAQTPADSQRRIFRWDGNGLTELGFAASGESIKRAELNRFSADGQRLTYLVYPGGYPSTPYLYQQRGTGTPTLISRDYRQGADPSVSVGVDPAFFPSRDGTTVAFAAFTPIVPGTVPAPDGSYQSIYRWNSATDTAEDLLAGRLQTDSDKQTGVVLVASSPDGAYLYFTSRVALTNDATTNAVNLYVLHGTQLSLVTSDDFGPAQNIRLSADGSRIAFGGGTTGGVRTFDSDTPSQPPVCVSCSAGGQPVGNATFGYEESKFNDARSHPVLDDGRVFFDTTAKLSMSDGNSTSDVYEYLPGGERRLISAGGSGGDSRFDEVTPDGTTVFFRTAAGLVPQDTDGVRDIYAARVGGGLASQQTAPTSVQPCSGSECQGAPPAPRPRPTTGSSTLVPFTPPLAAVFKVGRPSSSALRGLARSGRLKLTVRVGGPGRVRVRARAKLGKHTSTVATASATARKAGNVTLLLKLSGAARRELARHHSLRVAATVAFSQAGENTTLRFTVRPARAGSSSKGGAR